MKEKEKQHITKRDLKILGKVSQCKNIEKEIKEMEYLKNNLWEEITELRDKYAEACKKVIELKNTREILYSDLMEII